MTSAREPVNLAAKFALLGELWHPRIVAEVDDYFVKIAKVEGEFVWHTHDEEDELFLVVHGSLTIQMRDRQVTLGEGELFVVPRGVEHCPRAADQTHVVVLERKTTAHTGAARTEMTVDVQDWI